MALQVSSSLQKHADHTFIIKQAYTHSFILYIKKASITQSDINQIIFLNFRTKNISIIYDYSTNHLIANRFSAITQKFIFTLFSSTLLNVISLNDENNIYKEKIQ